MSDIPKNGNLDRDDAPAEDEDEAPRYFICNICQATAHNDVVTLCGHLFCWSCLNQWLENKPRKVCPAQNCNVIINRNTLVPIYGTDDEDKTEGSDAPPRPPARRIPRRPNILEQLDCIVELVAHGTLIYVLIKLFWLLVTTEE